MHTNNTAAASGFGFRQCLTHQQSDQNGNWLGLIFLGMWLLVVVDGLWTYTMAKLAGGHRLPLTPIVWGVLYLGIFNAAFVNRRPVILSTPLWTALISLALYLPLALIVQINIDSVGFIVGLHGYYVYYFFILAFPFSVLFQNSLNSNFTVSVFIVLGLSLAVFGSIQHFSHNLFEIGQTIAAESGAFNLGFHGRVRANGLFAHSEDLGHFLSMVAGIVFAIFLNNKSIVKKIACAGVLIVLAVGVYSTLTRSAYIAFVATLFSVWFIRRRILLGKSVNWLPFLLLAAGFFILFGRTLVADILTSFFDTDLFSSSSLEDRLAGINYYIALLNRSGFIGWLFGKGWIFLAAKEAYVPIDMGFFAIILSIGLIGLVIWLLLTYYIWKHVASMVNPLKSSLSVGLAATISIWLLLSAFGVVSLYQMAALLIVAAARK